jgi:hypothetical protein
MSSFVQSCQVFAITTSLVASGGIATLSFFDVAELLSQPASRSLPSIRWLFSRGSHTFPQAAALSSASFAYLAYAALGPKDRTFIQLLNFGANSTKVNGYLGAALLAISIAPFTTFVMIPTNFALIELNEKKGGARSKRSAEHKQPGGTSAEDSVNRKGAVEELSDLSGPISRTEHDSTKEEDNEARELLTKFYSLNLVRAVLLGAGGIVGLMTALS